MAEEQLRFTDMEWDESPSGEGAECEDLAEEDYWDEDPLEEDDLDTLELGDVRDHATFENDPSNLMEDDLYESGVY